MRRSLALLPVLALPFAALAPAGGSASYADGPPPAHTGGFGEPTCRACHFDNDLNAAGGRLTITGLPERYAPGERYMVTVSLSRAGMERAGFQLAVRHADGPREGEQAGELTVEGQRAAVLGAAPGVRYAQHTDAGTGLTGTDTVVWQLRWRAPSAGAVVIHVAANAGNGDGSEFGDYIYVVERPVGVEK